MSNVNKNEVTLAAICKSIKIDTKHARRVLRNSDATPQPIGDARWVWTKPNAAKVTAILKA